MNTERRVINIFGVWKKEIISVNMLENQILVRSLRLTIYNSRKWKDFYKDLYSSKQVILDSVEGKLFF